MNPFMKPLDNIGAFYWTLGLRHEELEPHEMEDA